MIMKKIAALLLLSFNLLFGCTKSSFLAVRPDNALVVPATLKDVQALLDNDFVMNGLGSYGLIPGIGETGADDYFVTDGDYTGSLLPLYRNCYTWAKSVYAGEEIPDWNLPYRCVFYSNLALDALDRINPDNAGQEAWNNAKGSALFYRAHMFYQLAQVFAPAYDASTAAAAEGIPLRLQADINEKIERSTVAQTYGQVTGDLEKAIPLLPVQPLYKTRPSKPAAYALLARVYLAMEDYNNALLYADSCLQLYNALLDYNTISRDEFFPFNKFNEEVLFSSMILSVDLLPVTPTLNRVDTNLYGQYDKNDLRKLLFFKDIDGLMSFCGTYDEEYYLFGGLATDEVLLIRAECLARAGRTGEALRDLNTLLSKRYEVGTFVPVTATDPEDALRKIVKERRKELLMRGLRWTDLRRLNKDPRFAKDIERVVDGNIYRLPANDPRYVYPIPDKVISFNPGMVQNER